MTAPPTRAEVAVAACADAWRGDGEVLAAAMAPCPVLGARLARATSSPDLLTTDGAAVLTRDPVPLGADGEAEGWLPFRDHLWLVLHGRRHVMLGASQMDAEGRTNISCVGDWERPTAQLLGVRGCPGNTVRNTVSYWVPRHSRRVFTPKVDMVSGVAAADAHELRRVVTDLAVMDFAGPGRTLRLVSVHPGCTVERVRDATGFDLALPEGGAAAVSETRSPTGEELRLLREVLDPGGVRDKEVPG